jgi:hypothetical protein
MRLQAENTIMQICFDELLSVLTDLQAGERTLFIVERKPNKCKPPIA